MPSDKPLQTDHSPDDSSAPPLAAEQGESPQANGTSAEDLTRAWPTPSAGALSPDSPSNNGDCSETEARGGTRESDTSGAKPTPYRVVRHLGQGGSADVYLAVDEQLGRMVALKVPRPGVCHTLAGLRHWLREAEAVAKLDHPNLVTVYEAAQFGDSAYIAYSYCSGPNLKQWIASQPQLPDPRLSARILLALCGAMIHAHSRGVLHRDLKPANILLEPLDDGRSSPEAAFPFLPKVTDFGLARLIEPCEARAGSWAISGTLAYMAPEQAAGRDRDVSVATDVYGLGAILYELLTGRPPQVIDADQGIVSTLEQLSKGPQATPRQLRPEVPRDLEAVCLKCLATRPEDRYGCVQELSDDLGRFLQDRPVEARPRPLASRLRLWSKRHPVATVTIAALAVFSWASFVTLMWYGHVLTRWNSQLRAAVARAEAATRKSETSRRALLHQLYAGDMRRAYEAWQEGDPREYRALLDRYRPSAREHDVRTMPWYFLNRLGDVGCRNVLVPDDSLYTARFSSSGDKLAVAGRLGVVHIVSTDDYRELLAIHTGQMEVNRVCFSPDDRVLATAGDDGAVCTWDVRTGRLLHRWETHPGAKTFAVAFSPDGQLLASCGTEPVVRLRHAERGSLLAEFSHEADAIESLAFSPDGRWLAVAECDQELTVWDLSRGARSFSAAVAGHSPRCVAISADSRFVACGNILGTIGVFELATGKKHSEWRIVDVVQSLAFAPDGNVLVAGDRGGAIRAWEIGDRSDEPPRLLRAWPAHEGRVYDVAFSPDGKHLVSAGSQGRVRIWQQWQTPGERTLQLAHTGIAPERLAHVVDAVVVPGTDNLLVAHYDDLPRLWSLSTGGHRRAFAADADGWIQVAASPDGRYVAAATEKGGLFVWKSDSSEPVHTFFLAAGWDPVWRNYKLSFSPDGRLLAFCLRYSQPREAYLFDLSTGKQLPLAVKRGCENVAFPPPGGPPWLILSVESDLWLYDVRTLKKFATLDAHDTTINHIAFSADGRRMATASKDRRILLWDMQRMDRPVPLLHHRGEIERLAFSPDGLTLISGSALGELLMWDVRTRSVALKFQTFPGAIMALAVAPDSRHVVVIYRNPSHLGAERKLVILDTIPL